MQSIITTAFFSYCEKSSVVSITGFEPGILDDIQRVLNDVLHEPNVFMLNPEQSWEELVSTITVASSASKTGFLLTNTPGPTLTQNSDIYIEASYYENLHYGVGPRLIELSIIKAKGYRLLPGESIVFHLND